MNKNESKIVGVSLTLLFASALIVLSFNYLNKYEWITLSFIPVLIGFLPPYIAGKIPMNKKESYQLSFITLGFAVLILLIFPIKDMMLFTLAIAILIAAPVVWIFSYLAFRINDRNTYLVKDFFR